MRRHPVSYYEYHGSDNYYGTPYRGDRSSFHLPRKMKKSFAEKLTTRLDKLAKPRDKEKGYNRAYQEVYRDHFGNILLPRVNGYSNPEPWNPHGSSPAPRRTFHNVIPRGRSSSNGANLTWSGWDGGGGVYPHPHLKPTLSPEQLYGEVQYGEYTKFAINGNVCMCEDNLGGTQRGRRGSRKCKKCGFDRPGSDIYRSMRRSLSEESLTPGVPDPYEYMRKRRLSYPKPVFYDEQDEYEDIMFNEPGIDELSSNKTRGKSPKHEYKNFTRTQSMNLNNRNRLNTKDSKDMQNIAIRSSPLRTPGPRPKPGNRNIVTVNGSGGKNSSIIYLSADTSSVQPVAPEYPDTITISTSTPVKPINSGSINKNPYDLIKKYVGDSPPNSLSDSNLSSDEQPDKVYSKFESEFSDSESDAGREGVERFNSFKISGQKIQIYSDSSIRQSAGYSSSESDAESEYSNYDADCSVVESPRISGVPRDSMSSQEKECFTPPFILPIKESFIIPIKESFTIPIKESFTIPIMESIKPQTTESLRVDRTLRTESIKSSNLEYPRTNRLESTIRIQRTDSIPPCKPPRRKSVEKDVEKQVEDQLQVQDIEEENSLRFNLMREEMRPLAPAGAGIRQPTTCNPKVMISRKISSDSQKSQTSRSKSFSGSRDSLYGSVDLKHSGISANFSSEIIQELYGSKTSLLKAVELRNELRRHSTPIDPELECGRTPEEPLRRVDKVPEEEYIDGPGSGHYDVPTQITSPNFVVPRDPRDNPDYNCPDGLLWACRHQEQSTDDSRDMSRGGGGGGGKQKQEKEEQEIPRTQEPGGDGWEYLDQFLALHGEETSKPNPSIGQRFKPLSSSDLDVSNPPSSRQWMKSHPSLLQDLRQENQGNLEQEYCSRYQPMFQDTTRLRLRSRPSIKDTLQTFSTGTKLGRLGISQSFRDRIVPPRPRDPPTPPPSEPEVETRSKSRKFFSFNKSEMKKINKLLGIGVKEDDLIYDIAEDTKSETMVGKNSKFYRDTPLQDPTVFPEPPLKLKTGGNDFLNLKDSVKPGRRPKRERSKSFTPRTRPLHKALIFNRSLSQISKSSSSNLIRRSESCRKLSPSLEEDATKRTLSSSDLVTIFPEEERRSFKDIRKILSSPSISSGSTSSSIYRPKSQLSNSSSVINSIKEEQVEIIPNRDAYFEHIYEEINDRDFENDSPPIRPLPPIPAESLSSPRSSPRSSPILSEQSSPVKSIFEGASKYDILNYLEDARERGLTDCDLDLEEDDEDPISPAQPEIVLGGRNIPKRVSNISSSSSSSEEQLAAVKEKLGSKDIERNDSGLGSETGRGRIEGKIFIRKRSEELEEPDTSCIDCDQIIDLQQADSESGVCPSCSRRRIERKEIITEIIETEIKYGRDLRIILDQFYRPMQVAGLLTAEQLANVFLNVEELINVNERFTESLKDVIELALDQGDEDLSTVSIGKLFLQAASMLGAFKSYCTRQGSASSLLANLEREKELLRIFLRVSQMENTMLRRMNLSSFLMVPVQRVTRYPLLVSRLVKVTPVQHQDSIHLQHTREIIEQSLDSMNQETNRENSSTKLWRRISIMNPPARRSENQIDVLGTTTWGVRKIVLETLGWGREPREEINFVLEGRLLYTQPTETNWRNMFSVKMSPINVLLVTLGASALPPSQGMEVGEEPSFPRYTGFKEAALILLKEKGMRYSPVREPLLLGRCIICWEKEWDDCFEITEFTSKESFIFKGEDERQTLQWFKSLQFLCLNLGGWRKRRNGLANIMINGMVHGDGDFTLKT